MLVPWEEGEEVDEEVEGGGGGEGDGGEDAAALHALMIFLTPAWLGNIIFAGG